jgi:hypothetical protein
MARIRSVKPGLRTSRTVATWRREVRYAFVLLWGYLDDEGRGLDIPKAIAGDCFPLDDDVTPAVMSKWLNQMATTKVDPDRDPPLCRYEVAGQRYLHSVYWSEHQRPNRPSPSQHPQCPIHEELTESFTEPGSEPRSESPLSPQVQEGGSSKGELGGGGRLTEPRTAPAAPNTPDPEPPSRCEEHLGNPNPPRCGLCADARRTHQAWDAKRRARVAAAPKCRTHRGQVAATCAGCAADRKVAPDA